MRLRSRLTVTVTLVALAAVAISALLSVQVASRRVGHLLDAPQGVAGSVAPGQPGATTAAPAGRGRGTGRAASGPTDAATGATVAPGPAGAAARRTALLRDLWRANAQGAGIALLLAVIAGTFLATRLTGPLKGLTEVAKRYAAGERAARATPVGKDEVAEVGAAFNALADQLEAEEARQQRLLTDIAHELRTPLTVLKGELEALEDGLLEGSPATYRRLTEEVALLTRLVQDLRLLTQAERGALELERAPVDLRALVDEVTTAFRAHARTSDHALETDLEAVTVEGDADRLRQVLVNLLDNAARHAPGGTRIEVGLAREAAGARLSVRDHGPGIDDADRERVFERFYRTDRARSRAGGGTGLGLSIVRSLVALHGGSVSAANHPEGGAVLTVRLPAVGDAPPTEGPA